MLGNFDLRLVQHLLKVTNAERLLIQEVENAKPRRIAKALVDVNQFHARETCPSRNIGQRRDCDIAVTTSPTFVIVQASSW